jgi:hypothetical protein
MNYLHRDNPTLYKQEQTEIWEFAILCDVPAAIAHVRICLDLLGEFTGHKAEKK